MIFDFAQIRCILGVLQQLDKGKSKYSYMFRITKVSHITLQSVLKELIEKDFIKKYDVGHQNVDYEITNKGKKLLTILLKLNQLVR